MRSIRHIIYACTVLILSMGMSGCFDEVSSLEVEEKPDDDIHEKKNHNRKVTQNYKYRNPLNQL